MTTDEAAAPRTPRHLRALAGEAVTPCVTGITFVAPELLERAPGLTDNPATRLAAACAASNLDFAFVPSWEPWAAEAVAALDSVGVACAWVVPGVFWPALESVGVATGLRSAAHGPEELADVFDAQLAKALRAADVGVRSGVDVLVVADDLAGSSGPLADPAFLRIAVLPRLAVLTAVADEAGIPAILHSDGDVRGVMAAIAAAGFVALHGDAGGGRLADESLASARCAGLALIGGIPTAALSDTATALAAAEHAALLAHAGGLLLSDDGGVTTRSEALVLLSALTAARGV